MLCEDSNTLSANVTRTVFNQKITERYTSGGGLGDPSPLKVTSEAARPDLRLLIISSEAETHQL